MTAKERSVDVVRAAVFATSRHSDEFRRKVMIALAKRRVEHLQGGCSFLALDHFDVVAAHISFAASLGEGDGVRVSFVKLVEEPMPDALWHAEVRESLIETAAMLDGDGFAAKLIDAPEGDECSVGIEVTWSEG